MKAISIRLDAKLGREFDKACRKTGYKKNTLLTRFISSFVKHQKETHSYKIKKDADPFDQVIGSMKFGNLFPTEDAIDKIVYNL